MANKPKKPPLKSALNKKTQSQYAGRSFLDVAKEKIKGMGERYKPRGR